MSRFLKNHINAERHFKFKRSMLLIFTAVTCLIFIFSLYSCDKSNPAAQARKSVLNIGMILSGGGLGDKSFNDSAYQRLAVSGSNTSAHPEDKRT